MSTPRSARLSLAGLRALTTRLNTRDPDLYFKRIDRIRRGLIRSIAKMWHADFRSENRKLLRAAASANHPVEWRDLIIAEATRHYDPTEPYEKTYTTVWPFVAERVYDGLVGGKSFTKADPELVAEWERAALAWIRAEGGALIAEVEATSHAIVVKWVRRYTETALLEGWSMARLKNTLLAKLDFLAEWRATAIARTEVMRAANLGSRAAAKATGLNITKEWLTGPKGTGDRHATSDYPGLNHQKRKLDELYTLDGPNGVFQAMHPHDLLLPGAESINCRCSEAYIPK